MSCYNLFGLPIEVDPDCNEAQIRGDKIILNHQQLSTLLEAFSGRPIHVRHISDQT